MNEEHFLNLIRNGDISIAKVAELSNVSRPTVRNWVNRTSISTSKRNLIIDSLLAKFGTPPTSSQKNVPLEYTREKQNAAHKQKPLQDLLTRASDDSSESLCYQTTILQKKANTFLKALSEFNMYLEEAEAAYKRADGSPLLNLIKRIELEAKIHEDICSRKMLS